MTSWSCCRCSGERSSRLTSMRSAISGILNLFGCGPTERAKTYIAYMLNYIVNFTIITEFVKWIYYIVYEFYWVAYPKLNSPVPDIKWGAFAHRPTPKCTTSSADIHR
jgi:hypothetical protein